MKASLQNSILLCVLTVSTVSAKGLYEVVFVNTTNQEFTYSIDQLADIEKGAGKKIFKGGDITGTIKPLHAKVGAPSVTKARTRLAYEINKVTITTGTGQKMVYKIPSKAGNDLRGKDWVFEIIKEGNQIKVCRKWAHTKLQGQMTMAAEITGIIVAAIAVTVASGGTDLAAAGGGATTEAGAVIVEEGVEMTTLGASGPAEELSGAFMERSSIDPFAAEGEIIGTQATEEGLLGVIQGAEEGVPSTLEEINLGEATPVINSAIKTGLTVAAGLTVASAAVIGALEIAAEKTEGAFSTAWKNFKGAFGLSRKMNKAGCGYFKNKKPKKKK